MRCAVIPLILALALACRAGAKPEERQVRFLALGEAPPFRQEVRDNVRYELDPPTGSIPPREVLVGFGKEAPEATPLRLGHISPPVPVPAGTGPLLIARRGDDVDAEPWLRLTRPESGDLLVLLWRDPKAGTWEKARSLVVRDDPGHAPAGSVRFINVSPASVGIVLGEEKLILEAGKSFSRTVPVAEERAFHVLLPDTTGKLKRLHSGVILQNPSERSLVLVYRADGENSRRPLKVAVQREPVTVAVNKK